ncbi:MAG: FAD-binding oxidoreductase [Candidatus Acidiferrales bacterium]
MTRLKLELNIARRRDLPVVHSLTFKQKPFWLDTVEIPAGESSRPLPERVDVAIIGAGFTGLSAARVLAKRGANVAVLESETIGWGASSRNGGMVLTGLKLSPDVLLQRYGREATQRMFAASLASIDCVEQIVREEKIACDFSRSGHLEVAWKPSHFAHQQKAAVVMEREFGHRVEIVPKRELRRREIGSDLFHGGIVDILSAGVNPARYVAGLAQGAQRAGAAVYEHTRVEKIERIDQEGKKRFRLHTSRGAIVACEAFAATSGYTGPATPALQKKIIPIGSFIIVTEPLSEEMARQASPRNRMIYDSKNFLYYFRLTPDRRMLFGGRAAFFPETSSTIRRSAGILRRGMVKTYPYLRDAKIEYAWGGTLDFAFDILPHAGQLDGMYYALGYAGHGVAMATYLGMKMGELIAGGRDENPFAGLPFPGAPLGLYNGKPWFLPFAGAWYKFLDWFS